MYIEVKFNFKIILKSVQTFSETKKENLSLILSQFKSIDYMFIRVKIKKNRKKCLQNVRRKNLGRIVRITVVGTV